MWCYLLIQLINYPFLKSPSNMLICYKVSCLLFFHLHLQFCFLLALLDSGTAITKYLLIHEIRLVTMSMYVQNVRWTAALPRVVRTACWRVILVTQQLLTPPSSRRTSAGERTRAWQPRCSAGWLAYFHDTFSIDFLLVHNNIIFNLEHIFLNLIFR